MKPMIINKIIYLFGFKICTIFYKDSFGWISNYKIVIDVKDTSKDGKLYKDMSKYKGKIKIGNWNIGYWIKTN